MFAPSFLIAFFFIAVFACAASAASPLASAGYSVLPPPRKVALAGGDVSLGADWRVIVDASVAADDVAIAALKEGFAQRHGVTLSGKDGPAVRLSIVPGAVAIGEALDKDRDALATQAYKLEIGQTGIHITANAAAGLFYGVETLVQLIKHRDGALFVPAGEIVDWPDLRLRQIYWDDAHHLEQMDAFKAAIRQAAFYKINGFVLKLEGHFQFKSAPALVEPQALSAEQLQELTDYGLRYHVQLIPYIDAPGHIAFILKHPEYASLRAFADCNYQLNMLNPDSVKLLQGMFGDLIDANKGVDYVYLSTDEPYYVGKSEDAKFNEAARQKELGSPGKLLAEFVSKVAGYLHDRGRTVVFWGESPTKPDDIASFPAYLVQGEPSSAAFDAACKQRGIRQMLYTPTQGEEKLFPDYYLAGNERKLHERKNEGDTGKPRVVAGIEGIARNPSRERADNIASIVAGWGDSGLHPETFWLGYATISSAAWNPATDPAEASAAFMPLFYGLSAQKMDRVYEMLALQAQFYADSWEMTPSTSRKGIWGNSSSIFTPRRLAQDQSIALPAVPAGDDLEVDPQWAQRNTRRTELVRQYLAENDELRTLLRDNTGKCEFNGYNLEVLTSICELCQHNLNFLQEVAAMDASLAAAHKAARDKKPDEAVAALDDVLKRAAALRDSRDATLKNVTATWYKSWCERVSEANGRKFLHDLDDVKDHLPDRTVGMEYLVYREMILPMGPWLEQVRGVRNAYAKKHGLVETKDVIDWGKLP